MSNQKYLKKDFWGDKYWEDENGNRQYYKEDIWGDTYEESDSGSGSSGKYKTINHAVSLLNRRIPQPKNQTSRRNILWQLLKEFMDTIYLTYKDREYDDYYGCLIDHYKEVDDRGGRTYEHKCPRCGYEFNSGK